MPADFAVEVGLLLFVALVVLFTPLVLAVMVWRLSRRVGESDRRWSDLTGRVHALEGQIKELAKLSARHPVIEHGLAPRKEDSSKIEAEPAVAPLVREIPTVPPQKPPTVSPPVPLRPPAILQVAPGPVSPPSAEAHAPPVVPEQKFTMASSSPSATQRAASIRNIEEVLGTNWLNKLGIVILVIGVVLFLAYQVRELGPWGKVLVGYGVGGALLGAGIFYERREHWRILARAGIGGGWALLFFVTWGMHHVAAARVIERQWVDLILLLIVASVMVAHTLRFDSQAVTGLAFLLAFSTVTISRSNAYSLTAGALLAAGLVVIVVRKRWYELEVFGILASYLNHYYWLRPVIEPMRLHHRPFPEFFASASLLVLYWAVFRASYLVRRVQPGREETVSSLAALLNTGLLLAIMKYQSVHPELSFWFLLGVGAAELALGQIPIVRRRRTAFVVLTTLGATLLFLAFPFKFSGHSLSIWWLAEAETFFLVGVFTREVVFRRLGTLAGWLVGCQIAILDTRDVVRLRSAAFWDVPELRLAWVYGVAALALYLNAHAAVRRWPDLLRNRFDRVSFEASSYLAGAVAFLGVWVASSEYWYGLAWCALALGLVFLGARLKILELSIQAHCVAAIALLRLIVVNLATTEVPRYVSLRVLIISLAAALVYAASRWAGQGVIEKAKRVGGIYVWAGTGLLALLAWYHLRPASVALGWALLGLVFFELGMIRPSANLRAQAYVMLGSSFLRIFFVNLNAQAYPGELSPRFYTTVPLALAFYYVYGRLSRRTEEFLQGDLKLKVEVFQCYLGTLTIAALIRFEAPPDWVGAMWAGLGLGLIAVAWRAALWPRGLKSKISNLRSQEAFGRQVPERLFLHQAYLVALATIFRTVLHNFYERSYFPAPFWQSRVVSVGVTVGVLLLALAFARQLKTAEVPGGAGGKNLVSRMVGVALRHPEQVFFFAPFLLLTVLLAVEMRRGMVTVGWGIEAVAVFIFALWMGERSYRLSGLGLLLLCVAKIVVIDVWGLAPRDRYLTFVVLGGLLLAVSYLYTRYRATISQYL